MLKIKKIFKELIYFLGNNILRAMCITFIIAVLLGLVEYGFAICLEHFLKTLNIISRSSSAENLLSFFLPIKSIDALFVLILLAMSRAIFSMLSSTGSEYVKSSLVERLRNKLLRVTLWESYENRTTLDDIGNYLGEIFVKSGNAIEAIVKSVVACFQSFVLLILMIYTSGPLAIYAVLGILFTGVLFKVVSKFIYRISNQVPKLNKEIVNHVNQCAQNRMFLQVSGIREGEDAKGRKRNRKYFILNIKAAIARYSMVSLLPVVGLTALFSVLTYFFQDSETVHSNLFAFVILFVRFTQNLSGTINFFSQFVNALPSLKIAMQFWKYPSFDLASTQVYNSSDSMDISAPSIRIENLSYSYGQKLVLSEVNANIKCNSIFGFIGKSGSGKSTLMSLILGLLKPSKGEVLINSVSSGVWIADRISTVAYVGVNPFVINGTIKENLLYGSNASVSDEEISVNLKAVCLYDEILSLDNGIMSVINEFGDGLSSGQKQRLAIARALIKKPLLLILDEATANLDEYTEDQILKNIKKLKVSTTILIISHKSSHKKYFDSCLELK